jgi:prepilin-type N-terminal cleavage/methylation domain-containing protein
MRTGIRGRQKGLSLIELMVTMLISLSLMLLLWQQYFLLVRTQYEQQNLYRLLDRVRMLRVRLLPLLLSSGAEIVTVPVRGEGSILSERIVRRWKKGSMLLRIGEDILYLGESSYGSTFDLYHDNGRSSRALVDGVRHWSVMDTCSNREIAIQLCFDTPLPHGCWDYRFDLGGYMGLYCLPFIVVMALGMQTLWSSATMQEKILGLEKKYLVQRLV